MIFLLVKSWPVKQCHKKSYIKDPDRISDDDGDGDAAPEHGPANAAEAESSNEEMALEAEPSTRAAFNALRRSFNSTIAFVQSLYSEPLLQLRMRMLVAVSSDLRPEYQSHLEAESHGQLEMLRFAMARASGQTWYSTIMALFQRFSSESTVDMLRLTPASRHVWDLQEGEDDRSLQREFQLLREYWTLVVQLASNRAWSQAFYGLCFPYCLARLSDPSSEGLVEKIARGILRVEQLIENNPKMKALQDLLSAVGTNHWLVTREAFVCGINKGWSIQSNTEMKEMVFALFGGPNNTKGALENTFSSVKDACSRYNKNMRQGGNPTKWLYTCTSPYAKQGGLPQLELDKEDFAEYIQSGGRKLQVPRLYDLHKHSISQVVPRPQEIVSEARKASHLARPNSAAATSLILHCMDHGFERVSDSWAGSRE